MDDRQAIEALMSQYLAAYEANDAQGCAGIYADDALAITPWGPPLRGPKAIAAAHIDWFTEGETNKIMAVDELHIDGDIAFCLWRYEAKIPNGEKVYGVSLNTFQCQPDGGWKLRHTSLNELQDNHTGFSK